LVNGQVIPAVERNVFCGRWVIFATGLMKQENLPPHYLSCRWLLLCMILCACTKLTAQNPHIRCYFNKPVNTQISTGTNAAYLQNTFPDTIAAYINRAKYTVDIALYNYTGNANSNVAKIATAVNAAAARGVTVRWLYNLPGTSNSAMSLLSAQVNKGPSANYNSYIMHNKFMVIDINSPDSTDVIAQTGSYNWSDFQTGDDYNNIIFIQSKQVALAFYNEFNKMWGSDGAAFDAANARFSSFKTASAQTKFNVNGTAIEVYFSPKDSLGDRLESSIRTANHDLFFSIYAFTDFSISNEIKNRFNSGVTVRGIMDEFNIGNNAYNNLIPALGSNAIVFSGIDLYHNKTMLVDPLNPLSDPHVFTGSFNWTSQGQFSNDENTVVIHDASIANQYYQSLCKDFTDLGGAACAAAPCPSGAVSIVTKERGSSYQWQVNTNGNFTNITDNSNYSGSNNMNLTITNSPTSWYGYQYRCIVNGITSDTTTLLFSAYWNGSTDTAWENTENWNCGVLPDANTDVIINDGVKFYPVVNNSTSCRSLRLGKNTLASVAAGITLLLTGR